MDRKPRFFTLKLLIFVLFFLRDAFFFATTAIVLEVCFVLLLRELSSLRPCMCIQQTDGPT